MSDIKQNIQLIKDSLPSNIKLVAVSKTRPIEEILEAIESGQVIFGENRAQEMADKHSKINFPIEWHMIGHLQSNKIKHIAPFVSLIHSVDSFNLLKEINKEAKKNNRVIECLLQIFIAKEDTKFGFSEKELFEMLYTIEFKNLKNICIRGLMGMATFTDNNEQTRKEFKSLKQTYNIVKSDFFKNNSNFCELSMGMSGDYKIAIEEGSTIIRIGSSIFGNRNYIKGTSKNFKFIRKSNIL